MEEQAGNESVQSARSRHSLPHRLRYAMPIFMYFAEMSAPSSSTTNSPNGALTILFDSREVIVQPNTSGLTNPVKDKLRTGRVALGLTVRIGRSPDIARIARATGHDFIFIDVQHSIFNLETIIGIAHTALAIGIAPLVRVRSTDDPEASLLLDNGVTGIIYPDVSTAAQARKAVDVCKFPPIGKRSVVGGYPHFDYRGVPLTEVMQTLNELCLLVCMIETVEGLNNVEHIAAIPGVDVVHLGSNDLLCDMGKPGKFDDPDILAAQDRVINSARTAGIFAGCGGNRDVDRQVRAIRTGAQFVTTQTDIGFLSAAAAQWTQGIRKGLDQN